MFLPGAIAGGCGTIRLGSVFASQLRCASRFDLRGGVAGDPTDAGGTEGGRVAVIELSRGFQTSVAIDARKSGEENSIASA